MVGRRSRHKFNTSGPKGSSRALPGSLERLDYLQRLFSEYRETDIPEHKEQIVANLANFCYDPRNGPQLRQLNVVDLFFDILKEPASIFLTSATEPNSQPTVSTFTNRLVDFALGGLSNLSAASPIDRQLLIDSPNLSYVAACVTSPEASHVVHSLTILIHLFTHSADFKSISLEKRFPAVVRAANTYRVASTYTHSTNKPLDPRIGVLSQILLEDCCNPTYSAS